MENNENYKRWENVISVYGEDVFNKIQKSKVLVVGAGGIGCELLKNLVLNGFQHIDVVCYFYIEAYKKNY